MLLTGGHPMYATKVLSALEKTANWLDDRRESEKSLVMTYVLPWQEGIGSGFWDVRTMTHVSGTQGCEFLDGQRFFNSLDGDIKFGATTDTAQKTVDDFARMGTREVDMLRGCITAQSVDPVFENDSGEDGGDATNLHEPYNPLDPRLGGGSSRLRPSTPVSASPTGQSPVNGTSGASGGSGMSLAERGQEAAEQFLRRTLDSLKVDRAKILKELNEKNEAFESRIEDERVKFRKEAFETIQQARCAREVAEHARDASEATAKEHQRKAAEAKTALAELKAENSELNRSMESTKRNFSKQEKALNASVSGTAKQLAAAKKQHEALVVKTNAEIKALKLSLEQTKTKLTTGETISDGRKKRLDVLESQTKTLTEKNAELKSKLAKAGLYHSQTQAALAAESAGLKKIVRNLQERVGRGAIISAQRRFRMHCTHRALIAALYRERNAILQDAEQKTEEPQHTQHNQSTAAEATDTAASSTNDRFSPNDPDAAFVRARHVSTSMCSTGVGTHTNQCVQTDPVPEAASPTKPTCVADASRAAHVALKNLIELSQAPRSDYMPEFLAHHRPTFYSGMAREPAPSLGVHQQQQQQLHSPAPPTNGAIQTCPHIHGYTQMYNGAASHPHLMPRTG
jgi:hypothetical protein